MTNEMAEGIINMLELKQQHKALQIWVSEEIKLAAEELAECREDDPNSYASGYEAGTLSALHEVKSMLNL